MAKKYKCPCPPEVYDAGHSRVEGKGKTEDAALAAMRALLPRAHADALKQQDDAYEKALKTGKTACAAGTRKNCLKCAAWFRKSDLGAPWEASGALAPYTEWLARGGYSWTVLIKCECEPAG